MKVVFTTNSDYNSYSSHRLLKVAITSLKANTTLEPVVIWDGYQDRTTGWLEDNNVPIIYHELSFKDKIKHFDFHTIKLENRVLENMYKKYSYYNKTFIETESMRLDIPDLFPDEKYVLYCDCDVLFLKDPVLSKIIQPLGGALREEAFFNNGVMLFNIPEYKKQHEAFKNYYINSNYTFKIGNVTTQGAYNTYFKGSVADIGLNNNWHSFMGINPNASIIHFCGPKPFDILNENKMIDYEIMYTTLMNDSARYYTTIWSKYESTIPLF